MLYSLQHTNTKTNKVGNFDYMPNDIRIEKISKFLE